MRYLMKQKLFAWGDDFAIKDANDGDRYFVDGRAFSLGDKLSFQDMQGAELARVEQKVLSLGKTYEIHRDGRLAATVKKSMFTLFRTSFSIEDETGGDLDVQGDFRDHEYRFTRDGNLVASVSKRYFSLGDSYGVDIVEGEDDVLILAASVVIDMCCHD